MCVTEECACAGVSCPTCELWKGLAASCVGMAPDWLEPTVRPRQERPPLSCSGGCDPVWVHAAWTRPHGVFPLVCRTIVVLTQTLKPLPDDVTMTMKLLYFDDGVLSG